jgi:hypothetical protein
MTTGYIIADFGPLTNVYWIFHTIAAGVVVAFDWLGHFPL